jgi:hypothetical protein
METTESVDMTNATPEERIAVLEETVAKYHTLLTRDSMAIHRLEAFAFSLVKLGLDSGTFTLDDINRAQFMLATETSILSFWDKDISAEAVEAQAKLEGEVIAQAAAEMAAAESDEEAPAAAPAM